MTSNDNTESDLFEQYLTQKIVPLIDEMNALKARYRSRFWGALWIVMFLVSANSLFVLFNTIIYNNPLNIEQLLLIVVVAIFIIIWPLQQYKKKHYPDIFKAFWQFYGDWQYFISTQKNAEADYAPILPPHDAIQALHTVKGKYLATDIIFADVQYWQKNKKVSNGVYIELTFPQKIVNKILLFARNGFYRKNKYSDMNSLNEQIFIPAAAYFNIFSPQPQAPKRLLCSPFFEKILDIRDIFKADRIYVALQQEKITIYLENSKIYFSPNGIWQRKLEDKKFRLLHCKITEILEFIELIQEIYSRNI